MTFKVHSPILIPYKVGHPPCKLYSCLVPSLFWLYQNTTEPSVGQTIRPTIGNAVPPPSNSDNWIINKKNNSKNDMKGKNLKIAAKMNSYLKLYLRRTLL